MPTKGYALRMLLLLLGCSEPVATGALLANGRVVCELVEGRTRCATVSRDAPYPTADGIDASDLVSLSMSGNLLCGLDGSGAIHCGGFDQFGLLDVPEGVWSAVAAGNSHACALDSNGVPSCWGADYAYATEVPEGLHLRSLYVGDNRSCGQHRDDEDWVCWGYDRWYAEQGITLAVPTAADGPTALHMFALDLYGILPDGSVGVWGYPGDALGLDLIPSGTGFVKVDAGTTDACALKADGRVQCWGTMNDGEDAPPQQDWTDMAAGEAYVCGRDRAGTVRCWGCGGSCPNALPDIP